MKTSEKTSDLTKAMSEFQSRLVTLAKDTKVTLAKDTKAYSYNYTTLAAIWESFRPLLHELGLFIFQDIVTCPEGVKVATRISHISDQWIETDYILIPMGKRDAHSTGSACTYGRRYSLSCALGIVSDDDDGAAAQKAAPKEKVKEQIFPKYDIDKFYQYNGEMYGDEDIREYVEEATIKMNKGEQDTINFLASLNAGKFKESFRRWQSNKESAKES